MPKNCWLLLLWLITAPLGRSWAQQLMLPPPTQHLTPPIPAQFTVVASYMIADPRGQLWLSTTNGLVRFDGSQLRVFHAPGRPQNDLYGRSVITPDGRLWARQDHGNDPPRLMYVDPRQPRIVSVADTTHLFRAFLSRFRMQYLYVDRRGMLWITLENNGLLRVNPRNLAVEHVVTQPMSVRDLIEAADGIFWLTTKEGLYALNPATGQTRHYTHDPQQPSSLGSDQLYVLRERADGDIVISLPNEIDLLNPRTGQCRRIYLPRPDPANTLWTNAFVADGLGNDYFSVGRMVFRLTATGELQRLEFTYPTEKVISIAISRPPAGRPQLWVSTITNTLSSYDLTRLRPLPAFNLLDVSINGSQLVANEQYIEKRLYRDSTGLLTLTVRENDFVRLRFSPFASRQLTTFRYWLKGYDEQWQVFTDTVMAPMYQLRAGQYTFLFNRAGPGGGWERQVAQVRVIVQPPFWKTTWFLTAMVVLAGSGLVVLYRTVTRRQQLLRALARQEGEASSLRQLDELKGRFFANITHELRTPITLLLNANAQLADQPLDQSGQRQVATIERNANNLMQLITQLLDMARLDGGKLDLTYSLGDPVAFVRQLTQAFDELAHARQIRLVVEADESPETYLFDKEKIAAICSNLLSNALKFTSAGGQVQIRAQVSDGQHLLIVVRDTGVGIPVEQQDRIFERFYQVDTSSTRIHNGTGIGLAFARDLTELMGGTIRVGSVIGEGSTFTVRIPLNARIGTVTSATNEATVPLAPAAFAETDNDSLTEPVSVEATRPIVLIIEDNDELRMYLVEQMATSYQVIAAVDGQEGLAKALDIVPDLIVSDVMMPRMDGYALVGALKTDVRTSHIPVILLTARSSYDSVLRGLDMGADTYVSKPFRIDELKLRIRNAIQTRHNWKTRWFQASATQEESLLDNIIPEKESRFLERLKYLIRQHLQEEYVHVEWLAGQANMSRSQLHRKLTALTGRSTTQFIHDVRLEKAEELLRTGGLSVTEIAGLVGYNSPSYFTKLFQARYGQLPTQVKT